MVNISVMTLAELIIMAFYGIATYHTPLNSMVRFYEFLQLLENISSKETVKALRKLILSARKADAADPKEKA